MNRSSEQNAAGLAAGLTYETTELVTHDKTAMAVGSGALPVYATPMMIALMENCCMLCVNPFLEEGQGTVGTEIHVSHVSATPEGMNVRAVCGLKSVEGRKLTFQVQAFDEKGLIGEGEHERFIITEDRFLKKAQEK